MGFLANALVFSLISPVSLDEGGVKEFLGVINCFLKTSLLCKARLIAFLIQNPHFYLNTTYTGKKTADVNFVAIPEIKNF